MATWAVKPKTVGNSLAGAVNYDDMGLNWRVWQDEKPYVDMIKQERETYVCLLYTSPSPRDS